MTYQIIQPPFTLVFSEMSKKELKNYNEWFHKVLPERLQILVSAVQTTPGYEQWNPDFSPQSLEILGKWFLGQVETRQRTRDEIEEIEGRSSFSMNFSDQELTNRSFSLAIDIGMYLSQVFFKNHQSLKWSQPLDNKRSADYGQPVLLGLGAVPFNPIGIAVTLAYGLVRKSRTGRRLRELYDHWSRQFQEQ